MVLDDAVGGGGAGGRGTVGAAAVDRRVAGGIVEEEVVEEKESRRGVGLRRCCCCCCGWCGVSGLPCPRGGMSSTTHVEQQAALLPGCGGASRSPVYDRDIEKVPSRSAESVRS